METGLMKVTAELGKGLIEAAVEQRRAELQKTVLATITALMKTAEDQEELAKGLAEAAQVSRKRLAAIEAGEIDFRGPTLVFRDAELDNSKRAVSQSSLYILVRDMFNRLNAGQ